MILYQLGFYLTKLHAIPSMTMKYREVFYGDIHSWTMGNTQVLAQDFMGYLVMIVQYFKIYTLSAYLIW